MSSRHKKWMAEKLVKCDSYLYPARTTNRADADRSACPICGLQFTRFYQLVVDGTMDWWRLTSSSILDARHRAKIHLLRHTSRELESAVIRNSM